MENALTRSDIANARAQLPVNAGAASRGNASNNSTIWGSALRGIGKITKIAFVAVVGIAALWAGSAVASGVLAAAAPMLSSAGYVGAASWATWLSGGALTIANTIVAGAAITAGIGAGALTWITNTAWPAISSGFSGLFASASTTSGAVVAGGAATTTAATIGILQAKKSGILATQNFADAIPSIDPNHTQLLSAKKTVAAYSANNLASGTEISNHANTAINDPNNFSLFSPEGHEMQAAQKALMGHENHNNALAQKAAIKNAAHHAADQTLEAIEHKAKQQGFAEKYASKAKNSAGSWSDKVDASRVIDRGIDI